MLAIDKGMGPVVLPLSNSGAKLNGAYMRGLTALMRAVLKERCVVLERLIAPGANLFARECHGYTALALAQRAGLGRISAQLQEAHGKPRAARRARSRSRRSQAQVLS